MDRWDWEGRDGESSDLVSRMLRALKMVTSTVGRILCDD